MLCNILMYTGGDQGGVWILMSSQCTIIRSKIPCFCILPYTVPCSCVYLYMYPSSSRSVALTTRLCDHSASQSLYHWPTRGQLLYICFMLVCVGLGPAFKQLHSYVDDLAQVCSAFCDPPACSDSTPLYCVHHLLCSTLLPCTEHKQV